MPDAALLAEDVVAGYGPCGVVRTPRLSLARGELVGLLGANGAGKSTLLRALAGVLPLLGGRVLVRGDDLARLPPRERAARIAVLPQESSPAFPVSVLATVLLGRAAARASFAFESAEDTDAAEDALRRTGALALRDRDLTQLSGGERQRVLLARALCQGGEVLLCDEPTAHLDLRHQGTVFALLREIADAGSAVLVATHDLEAAAAVCDRLVLLGGGEVIASGRPEDVLTPAFLRRAFGIEAAVVREDGVPRVLRHLPTRPGGGPAGTGRNEV